MTSDSSSRYWAYEQLSNITTNDHGHSPVDIVYDNCQGFVAFIYSAKIAIYQGFTNQIKSQNLLNEAEPLDHPSQPVDLTPLCDWSPTVTTDDDATKTKDDFLNRVGRFTCGTFNPFGTTLMVGTTYGSLVVFSLKRKYGQSLVTEPQLWHNLSVDNDQITNETKELNERKAISVSKLSVCNIGPRPSVDENTSEFDEVSSLLVVALLSTTHAVVFGCAASGQDVWFIESIDTLEQDIELTHLALAPCRDIQKNFLYLSMVVSGHTNGNTYANLEHSESATVIVILGGPEALVVYHATSMSLEFIEAIDLTVYLDVMAAAPSFPEYECQSHFFPECLPSQDPSLLDIGIGLKPDGTFPEIMILWRFEGLGGSDWLQLLALENITCDPIVRVEGTGVDGKIEGACFINGSTLVPSEIHQFNPHHYLSTQNSLYHYCVSIVTDRSIEMLSIEDLSCLQRLKLPQQLITNDIQSMQQHTKCLTTSNPVKIIPCITSTSIAPPLESSLEEFELQSLEILQQRLPYLHIIIGVTSSLSLLWISQYHKVPKALDESSHLGHNMADGYTDPLERIAQLKQQIELSVERSKQFHSNQPYLEPSYFIHLFKELLSMSEDAGSTRNILPYVANLAKAVAFASVAPIRCLLSDTLTLLHTFEHNTLGSTSTSSTIESSNRSSLQLQKALQRLATFELLRRLGDDDEDEEDFYNDNERNETVVISRLERMNDPDKYNKNDEKMVHNHEDLHFDWSAWHRFLKCDLFKYCCQMSSQGELTKLILIINRHVGELDKDSIERSDKILKILRNLPVRLRYSQCEALLGDWIRNQILPLIHHRVALLEWIHTRAVALEAFWKESQPALGFLRIVFPSINEYPSTCKESSRPLAHMWPGGVAPLLKSLPLLPEDWIHTTELWSGTGAVFGDLSRIDFQVAANSVESIKVGPYCEEGEKEAILREQQALERLMMLHCVLIECSDIWTKHGLQLRAQDFLGRTPLGWTDVAYALLNRVRLTELLQDEIRVHVDPFCESHGLQLDNVLLGYIEDVLRVMFYDMKRTYSMEKLRAREQQAIALSKCLKDDESKAYALMKILSLNLPPDQSASSIYSSEIAQLVQQLQISKVLSNTHLLSDLRSALSLRELQKIFDKYGIRIDHMILIKTQIGRSHIEHLTSLLSWGQTSFDDALKVLSHLRRHDAQFHAVPTCTITEVDVAYSRLLAINSHKNKKLIEQIENDLRLWLAGDRREFLNETWKPFFIKTIKEVIFSRLNEGQIEALCKTFIQYSFLYLDEAAEMLQPERDEKGNSTEQTQSMSLTPPSPTHNMDRLQLRTAARITTITATAIYLCQSVISIGRRAPLGSRTYAGQVISQRSVGTCPIQIKGVISPNEALDMSKLSLNRPDALEVLERFDRLRKEFGVFIQPSKIPSKQALIDIYAERIGGQQKRKGEKQTKWRQHSREFQHWADICNKEGVKRARKTFWDLGATLIEEAADAFLGIENSSNTSSRSSLHHNLVPALRISQISSTPPAPSSFDSTRFTRLLQFGMLIGVGESYVRQSTIRIAAERATRFSGRPMQQQASGTSSMDWVISASAGVQCLRRLLSDIERNPSPQNAVDIITMLEDLVLSFQSRIKDHRFGIPLLVALSQIFDVGTTCLAILPINRLPDGIDFVWEVLLILQLLMQSDLVDIDATMSLPATSSDSGFSSDTRCHGFERSQGRPQNGGTHNNSIVLSNSFKEPYNKANQSASLSEIFPGFSQFSQTFLPRVVESLVDQRRASATSSLGRQLTRQDGLIEDLFGRRFQTFAVLYRRRDAINDGMEFLTMRIKKRRAAEETPKQSGFADQTLKITLNRIFDNLVERFNYLCAIDFLCHDSSMCSITKLKETAFTLYRNVIDARGSSDYELGAALALIIGKKQICDNIKSHSWNDVSRVLFHSGLLMDIGILFQSPSMVKGAAATWTRAQWRSILDDLGCHYDVKRFQQEYDGGGNLPQRELLPQLLITTNLDLDIALKFGKDFNIPTEEVLSMWLKFILIRPKAAAPVDKSIQTSTNKLLMNIHENIPTTSSATLLPSELDYFDDSYRNLTQPVVHDLNPQIVEAVLEHECLPVVSPYDYNRIKFILSYLKHKPIARRGLIVLHYIRNYKRREPPLPQELSALERHIKHFDVNVQMILRNLCKIRLPFHQILNDPWTILGPEIHDDTLDTFIPIAPLQFRQDDFHLQLLWNGIAEFSKHHPRYQYNRNQLIPTGKASKYSTTEPCNQNKDIANKTAEAERLETLLDQCYSAHPERALAAVFYILEIPELLTLGPVKLTLADWVARKTANTKSTVHETAPTKDKSKGDSQLHLHSAIEKSSDLLRDENKCNGINDIKQVNMRDGLPPFIPLPLRPLLESYESQLEQESNQQSQKLKSVVDFKKEKNLNRSPADTDASSPPRTSSAILSNDSETKSNQFKNSSRSDISQRWIVEQPRHHGWHNAGLLRAKWALNELHLNLFIPFLPECSLFCVYALYYYLTPILMRSHPKELKSPLQNKIFRLLSQYPQVQIPGASRSDQSKYEDSRMGSDDFPAFHLPENYRDPQLPISLHQLAHLICTSFGFNYKVILTTLIERIIKHADWNPHLALKALEKDMHNKTDDIIAIFGSAPSSETINHVQSLLDIIERSDLTYGLETWWLDTFSASCCNPLYDPRKHRKAITVFNQNGNELILRQTGFFIAKALNPNKIRHLLLQLFCEDSRTNTKSTRSGSLVTALESSTVIQTFYRGRSNYNLPQTRKAYLYLDAFDLLGISCTYNKFETADKSGFIRAFWRESRKVPLENIRHHDVQILYLIASMSLDFNVLDPRLLAHVLLRFLAISRIEKRQQPDFSKSGSIPLSYDILSLVPTTASSSSATSCGLSTTTSSVRNNSNSSTCTAASTIHAITRFEFPQTIHYVRAFLFTLFLDKITDLPLDLDFLAALQEIFLSSPNDISSSLRQLCNLNCDQKVKTTFAQPTSSAQTAAVLPIQLTVGWFALPPLLLNRSPYLHNQDILSIIRAYLELSHLVYHVGALATRTQRIELTSSKSLTTYTPNIEKSVMQNQTSVERQQLTAHSQSFSDPSLVSSASPFLGWGEHMTIKQQDQTSELSTVWKSRRPSQEDLKTAVEWLLMLDQHLSKNPELIWLCNSMGLKSVIEQHLNVETGQNITNLDSNVVLPLISRLQFYCSIVALHCHDLGFLRASSHSSFLSSLSHDLRGSTPALLVVASISSTFKNRRPLCKALVDIVLSHDELLESLGSLLHYLKIINIQRLCNNLLYLLIKGSNEASVASPQLVELMAIQLETQRNVQDRLNLSNYWKSQVSSSKIIESIDGLVQRYT